ncbi:hypothetical protein ACFL0G_03365 [Candidatus Zixiibacteriota bacterium]
MRAKKWLVFQLTLILILTLMLLACDEKTSQPEDGLNVSNDNPHCGLVAGFIRDANGQNLRGASVSISPLPSARIQSNAEIGSISSFINYPNPFTLDTHFAYYLIGAGSHTVHISIYNLHQELQREFSSAPGAEGPNKLYFDGLDTEEEMLGDGLYPCEVRVQSGGDTDSVRFTLSKSVNISDMGGLQSYSVDTPSDGKYVIDDVLLNIRLLTTINYDPEDTLEYPSNWPYIETGWTITDRFLISASKDGYSTESDTVTLTAGRVIRKDLTLR